MNQGTVNRTTAATNMNETSSRSHMVITVNFKQVNCGVNGIILNEVQSLTLNINKIQMME